MISLSENRIVKVIFITFLLICFGLKAQNSTKEKVIMAIFSHPDDEMTVAPILSMYAREGVKVYLVICTDGRYGTNDFSEHKAGDDLAALRREEMKCAAEKLGVELIHLRYHDQLRAGEGYDGHMPHAKELIKALRDIITDKQPNVLISWGPDGGSTHMDHRLVGASVTQIFLNSLWDQPADLYYVGTPTHLIDDPERRIMAGIDTTFLNTRIKYSKDDALKAMASLKCHESQVSPEMLSWISDSRKKSNSIIYLRQFVGPKKLKVSLFD